MASKNKTQYGIKEEPVKMEGDISLYKAEDQIQRNTKRIDILPSVLISRENGYMGGIKRVSAAYTANGSEFTINCDASSGAFDVILPDLYPNLSKIIYVTETEGTNVVTIKDSASNIIGQILSGSINALPCLWNGDYWEKLQ